MTQKSINLGTADKGNGDPLRVAFSKVNDNFTELYTALGLIDNSLNLGAFEFTGSVMTTTDSTAIVIDQATTITSNLSVGGDIVPQTANGGDLGSSTLPWRSLYVSNNTIYIGGTAVGLDASGNLTVSGSRVGATSYADLTGKPTIPTSFSSLVNGAHQLVLEVSVEPYVTFPATSNNSQLGISGTELRTLAGDLALGSQGDAVLTSNMSGSSPGGIKNWTFSEDGSLEIPGDIKSEGNINIEINLADSTKRIWQFGEDGLLTFPDGTSQSTAGGGGGSTLINGAYTVSLGSDGSLTLPVGTIKDISSGYGLKLVNYDYASQLAWQNGSTFTYGSTDISSVTVNSLGVGVSVTQDGYATEKLWQFGTDGSLTIPGDIKSDSNINIEVNLTDSTLRRWQFGEDGGLTFPEGYLKIVPNGANPFISNRTDNGLGLVSGSAIQIRQSVADAYGITIDSSTTDTSLGGGNLLASGSAIDVNGTRIVLGQYTSNYLDADTGLTGQNKIEINNDAILIGLNVSTLTDGVTSSTFDGWTFNGQADTLTFPDATVQTTAYNPSNIRSEGNINIEVNLADSTLRRWQFGEDGSLTLPSVGKINNGAYDWTFGSTGILTLPAGGNISEGGGLTGAIKLTPSGGANAYQALLIYPTGNAEGDHIHLTAGGGTTELYLGSDNHYVKLASGGVVRIQADDGVASSAAWVFGTDGELALPNNGKITSGVDTAQVGSTTTIALNSLGTDQANNNINVGIDWTGNEAVFTTYVEGSTITFANGDVRTITEIQKNEVYGEPGVFAIDIYWSSGTPRENLTAFPITLKTSNYAAAYTAPEWQFGTNGSLTFPDNTVQSTAWTGFSVAADDSTQRSISSGELVKFIGAGGVTTESDAEGNITITGSGGGSSIPAVVTTSAIGVDGAAHCKVQFTVTSATTVTAVGVTAIGVSDPSKGTVTLSGSPGTGAFDLVVVTNTTLGDTYILIPFATNASGTGYGAPGLGAGTNPCLVRGTMITMADMSRVAVENITYSDNILVWNFDLGEFASAKPVWIKKTQTAVVSCLLTFSDYSELRIVGDSPKAHRIFNKEAGKFTYGSMPETPIGTTTFNDQGEEITLISKEWIVGEVEFYNVMTDYHMNLFANSILTSMRYNNLYPITDMKFVKDSRTLRTADDYPNVEERLYKGFRLAEQTQSVEEIETHIQWLLTLEVERETECV